MEGSIGKLPLESLSITCSLHMNITEFDLVGLSRRMIVPQSIRQRFVAHYLVSFQLGGFNGESKHTEQFTYGGAARFTPNQLASAM